jgi:hypothetical protein
MRHSFRVTILLLAAGLVILAAGCGGSKKVVVVVTHPGTTGATGGTGPTGAGPTGSTGTTTASGGSGFASAKNCLAFAGVAAKIASAMAPTTASSDPKAVEHEFQALADAAPSEVKADFQTLADAFSGYMTALSSSGYKIGSTTPPTAAQMAALVQATKVFTTSKLKTAEKHLRAWTNANCKAP